MRPPHGDPIRLGPTPYEVFRKKERIPSVTGFFIEDLMEVETGKMGSGAYFLFNIFSR